MDTKEKLAALNGRTSTLMEIYQTHGKIRRQVLNKYPFADWGNDLLELFKYAEAEVPEEIDRDRLNRLERTIQREVPDVHDKQTLLKGIRALRKVAE